MKRDLVNNINPIGLIFANVSDNTAQESAAVDVRDAKSCTFIICIDDIADVDATFTVEVSEGDDSTVANHTPVADKDLLGTEADAGFTFADDGDSRKIGYVGEKDYVSISVTPANNAAAATFTVLAILEPNERPAPNPPE